ncbi:tail fiber assembly protein [Serratia sp. (in: enterobacteria)]|uniref:tail fiber assembly protein n=1 Tax=Serratia sp. (in: enterobacteria) TaxID=616 RepID=UPI0039897CBA
MSFTYSASPQALWLYQYDVNGAYIGSVFMHIPANMGLPANTTYLPCEPEPGQSGIFNGEDWDYIVDPRGTQYWNERGQGFVISSIGERLPDWAITITPPSVPVGCVLLYREDQWQCIENKTGQAFYEHNGNKHTVPDPYFTLPEGCTFIEPPDNKPTYVTQWDGNAWVYLKDLRGQTAYNIETKELLCISHVGPLPDGYTLIPPGPFDTWSGHSWIKDQDTERMFYAEQGERQKAKLLASATEQISVLTYAVDKDMATEKEKAKLEQWKEYRLVLNRLDTSTPEITWPERP